MTDTPPILELRNVSKHFPGVLALQDVAFSVALGDVHALVGENGAGKSTLVKILAGAHAKDSGEMLLHGQPVELRHPHHAQDLGIAVVHQEFTLIPDLSVAENISLGRFRSRLPGVVDWGAARRQARAGLATLGVELPLDAPVRKLTVAQQQLVEIVKALRFGAQLLVMDEPSAVLGDHDLARLFEVIRSLKKQGTTIIYISHRLSEIFEIADRVTVLKDGRAVGTRRVKDLRTTDLVRMMIGRDLKDIYPQRSSPIGPNVFAVHALRQGNTVRNVSFSVRAGEVLGLAGLRGAGRTETARAIFGADRRDGGRIVLDDKEVSIRSPNDAVQAGIGYVTEDRKADGLVLGMNVRENTTLASLRRFCSWFVLDHARERKATQQTTRELRVKTSSTETRVETLSGGNQQKVILAKWLSVGARVLILDEPTRGIDIGAKTEIYQLIRQLAARGTAIIMISSELTEVLGMADRVLIMHEGTVAAELPRAEASEERIMHYATGGA